MQRVEGVGHAVVDGKGRGRDAVDDDEAARLGDDGVDTLLALDERGGDNLVLLALGHGHHAHAPGDLAGRYEGNGGGGEVRAALASEDQVVGGEM